MAAPFAYHEPQPVADLSDCHFYHATDLPGIGEIPGHWDLRAVIEDYLGRFDFAGKRALDVGTASGFLTFEMERRGAEVVSFDVATSSQWNAVPYVGIEDPVDLALTMERLRNAYWLSHAKHGSQARVGYGSIYELPAELGAFDVVVLGMILGHLRDPLGGLHAASRLSREWMIVTNQLFDAEQPMAVLMPSREHVEHRAFWGLSVECVRRMLGIVGFEVVRVVESKPICHYPGRVGPEACRALVARRIAGVSV